MAQEPENLRHLVCYDCYYELVEEEPDEKKAMKPKCNQDYCCNCNDSPGVNCFLYPIPSDYNDYWNCTPDARMHVINE